MGMIWLSILFAYVIFSVAGFGTALVASPVLALFMPIAQIVPLLALLDFFAASSNLIKNGKNAELGELKRLVPVMVLGSAIGALILLFTKANFLLLLLGVFVIAYALYALSGYKPMRKFTPSLSLPFGLVGGVFSALFGSGGFVYSIYLSGRIEDKDRIRVTQSTLIGLSTLTRLVFFLVAGVYADLGILSMALLLSTAMLGGVYVGRHITLRLSREQFIKVVNVLVLFSGIFLLIRYFS